MAATTASDVAAAPTNAPEKLEAELAAPVNEPVHKTDEVAGADEEQGLSWTKEEEKGVLRKDD